MYRKHQSKSILSTFFMLLALSLFGGVVGAIFYESYDVLKKTETVWVEPKTPIVREPAVSPELEGKDLYDKMRSALVHIYIEKTWKLNPGLDPVYSLNERIGGGVLITSDGWIVAKIKESEVSKSQNRVVALENQIFKVDQEIHDSKTGLSFIHINADHLNQIAFAEASLLEIGTFYQILGQKGFLDGMVLSSYSHFSWYEKNNSYVLYSDLFSKRMIFAGSLDSSYLGAPVFTEQGEVVALVSEIGEKDFSAIPVSAFTSRLKEIFTNREIRRVSLGITYYNLHDLVGASQQKRGAYIISLGKKIKYENEKQIHLQNGDILVKIEEDLVGMDRSLAAILEDYSPEDEVKVYFIRNNQEFDTSIILER